MYFTELASDKGSEIGHKFLAKDLHHFLYVFAFQDGPQLVLQLYILAKRDPDELVNTATVVSQSASVVTSVLVLALNMLLYEKANR